MFAFMRFKFSRVGMTLCVIAAGIVVTPVSSAVAGPPSRIASAAPVGAGQITSAFTPLVPARLLDTRPGFPTVDGVASGGGVVAAGATLQLKVTGRGGVPDAGVGAVVLNVVAANQTSNTYVTVFPTGSARPNAANLNPTPGIIAPNLVVAKVGDGGQVSIFNYAGNVDVIVDVQGWLPTAANQPNSIVTIRARADLAIVQAADGSATVTVLKGTIPSVGQIVVTSDSSAAFYGTVTGVQGNTITTTPADLDQVIPVLDVSVSANPALGTTQVSGPGVSSNTERTPTKALGKGVSAGCSGSVSATASLIVTADPGHFILKATWNKWNIAHPLKTLELAYNPTFDAQATASLSASGSCSFTANLFDVQLDPITFSVGVVPVVITQHLAGHIEGSFSVQASASVTASVHAEAKIGALWDNGNFALENSVTVRRGIDPSLQATGTADLYMPIEYTAAAYGIVGFTAAAGPFLHLAVDLTQPKWLVLTGGVRGSVTPFIHFFGLNVSHTFGPSDLYKVELWSLTGTAPGTVPPDQPPPSGTPAPAPTGTQGTTLADVGYRAGPGTGSVLGTIPNSTPLTIECTLNGTSVTGPYGATAIWDRVSWQGSDVFVSDAWVYTGTAAAVASPCATPPPTSGPPPQTGSTSQGTMLTDLNYRDGPGNPYPILGTIPNGTTLTIECTLNSYSVSGPYGSSNVWDRVTWQGRQVFVTDAWVYTGTSSAVAPACSTDPRGTGSAAQGTTLTDLNYRDGPGDPYPILGTIPNGTTLAIECTLISYSVTGPYGSSNIWDRVTWQGRHVFVTDAWMYTGTANAVAGSC